VKRRTVLKGLSGALSLALAPNALAFTSPSVRENPGARKPILVALELSGGNDGLNTVVPFRNDDYYRLRPTLGIPAKDLLPLDAEFGFNPGLVGLQSLWRDEQLAIVHGCGYPQPSYSHFTSMAYWHTGAPNRGNEFGWLGRVADNLAHQRRDNMLVNIGAHQSLAVNSKIHTPVVFDDPNKFQRDRWMSVPESSANNASGRGFDARSNRAYLHAIHDSAQASSSLIRSAWQAYAADADYGVAPFDLPKVAACIDAGLPTQLYHVSVRNNAFDTHVQQPALHRRLLSYVSDAVTAFVRDLDAKGRADEVVVLLYSEFGRRPAENANQGTDHGTANVMMLAGKPIRGGHYGKPMDLSALGPEDNPLHGVDFRRVYASLIDGWLGSSSQAVLGDGFSGFDFFRI
jgi:uncharacterized protein (DUF1501 family)